MCVSISVAADGRTDGRTDDLLVLFVRLFDCVWARVRAGGACLRLRSVSHSHAVSHVRPPTNITNAPSDQVSVKEGRKEGE